MKRINNLSPILIYILPDMFKQIGLTMTHIKYDKSNCHFSFKIKEFNPKIKFDYDSFVLELLVFNSKHCIDMIPIISIPWIYKEKNRFYAHWTGTEKFMGPYKSIEILLKKFLLRQFRAFINRFALKERIIVIHKTKNQDCFYTSLSVSKGKSKKDHISFLPLWRK